MKSSTDTDEQLTRLKDENAKLLAENLGLITMLAVSQELNHNFAAKLDELLLLPCY